MYNRLAALGPADTQPAGGKVDIVPAQPYKLAGTQRLSEGDEVGGRVAMTVSSFFGGLRDRGGTPSTIR
jgi:hypothetical protein